MAGGRSGNRSSWQEQAAGAGGRSSWQEQLAGAEGRSSWQEQLADFPFLIFHFSFFISGISDRGSSRREEYYNEKWWIQLEVQL
jgi:hypothetical protein